jgi:hypothetical protein
MLALLTMVEDEGLATSHDGILAYTSTIGEARARTLSVVTLTGLVPGTHNPASRIYRLPYEGKVVIEHISILTSNLISLITYDSGSHSRSLTLFRISDAECLSSNTIHGTLPRYAVLRWDNASSYDYPVLSPIVKSHSCQYHFFLYFDMTVFSLALDEEDTSNCAYKLVVPSSDLYDPDQWYNKIISLSGQHVITTKRPMGMEIFIGFKEISFRFLSLAPRIALQTRTSDRLLNYHAFESHCTELNVPPNWLGIEQDMRFYLEWGVLFDEWTGLTVIPYCVHPPGDPDYSDKHILVIDFSQP